MQYPEDFMNKVICGDCYDILSEIPDNSIDLIVTSPPYNVGIKYSGYDDLQDMEDYSEKMKQIFVEWYRVLDIGGRIVVNCPGMIMQHKGSRLAYLSLDLVLLLRSVGFLEREFISWIKNKPARINGEWACLPTGHSTSWGSWKSASNPSIRDVSEFIIVMHKQEPKIQHSGENDITRNEFLAWTSNVWYISPEVSMRRLHPAPYPEELARRAIKLYSYVDDLVLDPFCGSGTTCVVAKRYKRRFIGIDISAEYVEVSKGRVSQEYLF